MSKFEGLIADAKGFYARLDANNNKAWWQEHKGFYDSQLKAKALSLLETLAPKLTELTGEPVKTKLFRPHRDVRFSKDKTPYNTHLHMMWALDTPAPQNPVFFFGIGIDYVSAGGGMMGLDKPILENWRKFVDLDTDRVTGILGSLKDSGFSLREPALKRVPSPYAKDHVAGELLRMKGIMASKDIGTPDDLVAAISTAFSKLAPLNALLLQVAEA